MEIDYEKAYKAALETATQWIKDGCTDKERICLESAFPQLRESEDEIHRKWILEYLYDGFRKSDEQFKDHFKSAIDWLEKQKEHQENCTKFLAKILKHSAEGFRNILKKKGIDYIPHESFWTGTAGTFSKQECNEFYKWMDDMTMELVTEETPEYKKGFRDGLDASKKEQKPAESISRLTVQGKGVYKICPRCKERMIRDDSKVYTSMPPQYGYNCPKCGTMEFDTVMYDNPEMDEQIIASAPLYTIEQVDEKIREAQEWSEEDEKMLKWLCRIIHSRRVNGELSLAEESEFGKWVDKWLDHGPRPKAEWSEKDENTIQDCIRYLSGQVVPLDIFSKERTERNLAERLKSLRPQPKAELTLLDENIIEAAVAFVEQNDHFNVWRGIDKHTVLKALRSLKPHWEPSEEQIGALNYAYCELFKRKDVGDNILGSLQKLIDQLREQM